MKRMVALVALALVAMGQNAMAEGTCDELSEEVFDVRSWSPDRGEVLVEREHEWCVEDDSIGEAREVYTWYELLDRNGKAQKWFVAGNEIQRAQFAMRMLKGEIPPEALLGEEDLEDYEKRGKFTPASSESKSPSGECAAKVETTKKTVFPITLRVSQGDKVLWSDSARTGEGSRKYDVSTWWLAGPDVLVAVYELPNGKKDKRQIRTKREMTVIPAAREAALAPCFKK